MSIFAASENDRPFAADRSETRPGATLEVGRRIVFDVSSIARWAGPAIGIARAEHALADYARASRPDIILAIYDPACASFREVSPRCVESLVGWGGSLDKATFDFRRHWGPLRRLRSPRYPLFMALERQRIRSRSASVRRAIDVMQRLLWAWHRLPSPFADENGRRLDVIPIGLALGDALSLGPQDILATAGYDWLNQDPLTIGRQKHQRGFQLVAMCYDIIPLQFPEFFAAHDVTVFRRYWNAMFPLADRILVNSRRVESDVHGYCASNGLGIAETLVLPLGFDPAPVASETVLPKGLEPSRYILFVSTIEPRKGHAMLVKLWQRLLAEGVPQRTGHKLVFVGRRGWMVDALLRQIDDLARVERSLVHLEGVGDGELAGLYAAAAFCVFPSRYEGYGLPIIEAFSHGKAVIASTGGALPETVGGLSPCLDPSDEDAWYSQIKTWIEDPTARAPYEASIRASFLHPNWREAAAGIFAAVGECRASTVRANAAQAATVRSTPAVSVVMPVRNGEAFLDEAMRSILAQSFGDFEFLIVDDGSSDGTPDILRRHAAADRRIRVISQAPAGIVAALNRGIDEAAAPLIARMDADDVSLPWRFARQVEALARNPAAALVGSSYEVIDRRGQVRRPVRLPTEATDIREKLGQGCCIAHPTVLMRRDAVQSVGGYRPAFLLCEDHDLWLRLSERYDLINVDDPLLLYREHGGQLTWRHLEQRFLSELATRRSANCRRAGQTDPGDGASPITRHRLHAFGLSDAEIESWIVARALDTAWEANRAGNRRVAWKAFRLARRQRPLPWPIRLRFWAACAGAVP